MRRCNLNFLLILMRNIWSGAISFGLIHIPVKLYSATKNKSLNFDFLRKKDLCPVGFARVCKLTGEEVPYKDIVRGYEYQKGDYVVLHDEDFKRASPRKTQMIEITDFVDEDQIDSKYFVKPYYVGPDKNADKVYTLLLEALKRTRKVGIGKFVFRTREQLVALKAEEDILMLQELRFDDEIKEPPKEAMTKEVDLSESEIDMAIRLINHLGHVFKPKKYHDTYNEKLEALIEKKAHGKLKPVKKIPQIKATKVPDLMAALKESLEMAKKNKRLTKK